MIRLLSAALFLLAAACAPGTPDALLAAPQTGQPPATTAATPGANAYTIALVMKTLTNPFFIEMEKGARQAEAELGIHLIVKTGAQETSIEQQITIISGLIDDQVDAILIAPADSVQLIPVLKKAQDAGIVIINIDNQLDAQAAATMGLVGVPYISVDNEQGAYLAAEYIAQQVTEPATALILEGIPAAKNAQDRKTGALRAFAGNPNIQVAASQTAHWKIDEAYTVTSELFAQYPDARLLFCANDMMALGALKYLREQGRSDVLVAAFDALDEARKLVDSGELQVTVDQQAALQAYTGVQFAVRALQGEELPPLTLLDVRLVVKGDAP